MRLALVTPCLNQGRYIEDCLRSVLFQPGSEFVDYVVMDGGSTDGSKDIIEKYADRLHHRQSEKDEGPYRAVYEGFKKSDADIMGWLNVDDMLLPWALHIVARIFKEFPEVEWLTSHYPAITDPSGLPVQLYSPPGFEPAGFYHGENLPGAGLPATAFIQQESTFWRRSLWQRAGGTFDFSLDLAADFELWARFFQHAELYAIDVPLGLFRAHGDNRSFVARKEYIDEAVGVLRRYTNLGAIKAQALKERLVNKTIRSISLGSVKSVFSGAESPSVHFIRYQMWQQKFIVVKT